MIEDRGSGNTVDVPEGFTLSGRITGNGNHVSIAPSGRRSSLTLRINGNGNRVVIGRDTALNNSFVYIGNHVTAAHGTELIIGDMTTSEPTCAFYLYNSGNRLHIGRDCMISSNVTIRCGDSPHLIFDHESGTDLDVSEGVFIGDHVWIGEKIYITKNVTIPSESIAAACSVVTRRFTEPRVVLAGNPAKVVRQGIKWLRNESQIPPGSRFSEGFAAAKTLRETR